VKNQLASQIFAVDEDLPNAPERGYLPSAVARMLKVDERALTGLHRLKVRA